MNVEFPVDDVDLCALIGSRICHDLVSPVGAVGNGVELLGMCGPEAAQPGPEMGLVRESIENAQAKLRFFRIAYGQAGDEQDVGRAEILGILTELYKGGRLKVHWAVDEPRPRLEVKLAFLLMQCLESAMPYGGQIHIGLGPKGWRLQGDAEKLRIEPMLWEALSSGIIPAPLRPSQVHFGIVPSLLRRMQRGLQVDASSPQRLVIAA